MHRFAVATASATFLLLLVGGVVRGTGSSLACPDWPLCFGRFFPTMTGGVFYEHTHRLAAAAVGFMTFGLTVWLWGRRPDLRRFSVITLLVLCVQATLGGLNVILKLPAPVRAAHLGMSMVFFAMVIYAAWTTRPAPRTATIPASARRWIAIVGGAVYVQIVFGGLIAYTGGGSACLDHVPLCLGQVWGDLHPAAKAQMVHRIFAVVVALGVFALSWRLLRVARGDRFIRGLALAAPFLVLIQIALGVLSVTSMLGLWQVRAHLGGAALLGADLWLLWLATSTRAVTSEVRVGAAVPEGAR